MLNKIRKELDLYLLLLLSAILVIVAHFGGDKVSAYQPAIVLSILILLVNVLIKNRDAVQALLQKIDQVNVDQDLVKSGIVSVHPQMPYGQFEEKVKNAKREIIILQTWLKALNPISEGMIEAAARGVKIRILILNPNSEMARQRGVELGLERDSGRPKALFEGIRSAFKKHDLEGKVEVRMHERIPPFSLYLVDDWMMAGTYWHGRGSVSNPMLEIKGLDKDKLGWYYLDTFEEIWQEGERS